MLRSTYRSCTRNFHGGVVPNINVGQPQFQFSNIEVKITMSSKKRKEEREKFHSPQKGIIVTSCSRFRLVREKVFFPRRILSPAALSLAIPSDM